MTPADWKFYKELYPILDDDWSHTGVDSIRGRQVNWKIQIPSPDPNIDISAGIIRHPTWARVILRGRRHIYGDASKKLNDDAKTYSVEAFRHDCQQLIPEIVREANAEYKRWFDEITSRREGLE